MMKEILYLCDPGKNTECKKRGCHMLAWPARSGLECRLTRNPDYAQLDEDGKPIAVLVKEKRSDGDTKIYKVSDMRKN